MDNTKQWFDAKLEERGVKLSPQQWHQLEIYYETLVEWNSVMNLTGITERDAVFEKHFYDSITLSFFIDLQKIERIADIGSGAGFPSLPLKICFPHLKVVIVDSLNKRIKFLTELVNRLQLHDVQCIHGRAEDIARRSEHRDQYDLATARAVARLNVLNEFCLPFVKQGGLFAAMKGAQSDEEIREATFSFKELKGNFVHQHAMQLPNEGSERHIVIIQKTAPTPKKYPRKAGTPLKQPLV
ncbi:16S rRNA (guanine(527)-N(7))-methyltransferase RsmG [Paenibacillus sp. J5C_2022]|uniref:16S rRNA (guanine(527)-N(7))-methyltransferase RsmG n=1 Tax=Paenibacillus sp. J5C2022 TaxID=2977129 RepID=UPI0021D0AA61|nr:16S rRNA (guanine(527)-N(7))-methyltransferase RsmG [Paenibacillus sp. J5C2022]MCU6710988.1 16S rRNA (guanine(527)-N(7))-methyltransferase RsmG [Paenibacillus sp. J5C2022]